MHNNFVLTRSVVPSEYLPGEARETVSEIQEFLNTHCTYDRDATVTTERLYQTFLHTSKTGRAQYISKIAFGKVLSEVLGNRDDVFEVKRAENSERRGYRGLRLNE